VIAALITSSSPAPFGSHWWCSSSRLSARSSPTLTLDVRAGCGLFVGLQQDCAQLGRGIVTYPLPGYAAPTAASGVCCIRNRMGGVAFRSGRHVVVCHRSALPIGGFGLLGVDLCSGASLARGSLVGADRQIESRVIVTLDFSPMGRTRRLGLIPRLAWLSGRFTFLKPFRKGY
jgi:hypothetical protein